MTPYKSSRPMALPQTSEVRLEIAKAIKALLSQGVVRKFDPASQEFPPAIPRQGSGQATILEGQVARRISSWRRAANNSKLNATSSTIKI